MNTAQGSLVMIDLNTAEPKVFWNGTPVGDLNDVSVAKGSHLVTLYVNENPLLAEMAAAGIRIVRVAA